MFWRFLRWMTCADLREKHDDAVRDWAFTSHEVDDTLRENSKEKIPSPEERILRIREIAQGKGARL